MCVRGGGEGWLGEGGGVGGGIRREPGSWSSVEWLHEKKVSWEVETWEKEEIAK